MSLIEKITDAVVLRILKENRNCGKYARHVAAECVDHVIATAEDNCQCVDFEELTRLDRNPPVEHVEAILKRLAETYRDEKTEIVIDHGHSSPVYGLVDKRPPAPVMTEDSPIVVETVVDRCDHNRRRRTARLVSGPPHVMRHIGEEYFGDSLFQELSEKGYSYTVNTKFNDVSPEEFMGIGYED